MGSYSDANVAAMASSCDVYSLNINTIYNIATPHDRNHVIYSNCRGAEFCVHCTTIIHSFDFAVTSGSALCAIIIHMYQCITS